METPKVYHLTEDQVKTLAKLALLNGNLNRTPEVNEWESLGWVSAWDIATRVRESVNAGEAVR